MQEFHKFIQLINDYLWGPPMLMILFGTHLYLTFRLKFVQRHIPLAIKLSIAKEDHTEGDISHFGALTTALAATIGTGNIIGVATAVVLGGPGAILWMWLTGVFGIATKYAEAFLAVKYRTKGESNTMIGGPMFVLERGMNLKWLGILFSIFTAIAAFGIGNMTQANSIASLSLKSFDVPTYISGIVLAILTALVILGGIQSISKVSTMLIPFMAIFYILSCFIILFMNGAYIFPALKLIVESAFTPSAAAGGFAGATILMAMRYGVARGLFSNESGLGSAPIVAAAARTNSPVRQGLVASTGTFWDTVVVCAITGLTIVTSILKSPNSFVGQKGPELISTVFAQIPGIGGILLFISLFTFVFSTILGWSYYGEKAVEYLVGNKGVLPYRILWVFSVFIGSVLSLPLVWDLSDAMNALMAIPNVISLLFLSGLVAKETDEYFHRLK